jgi:hypothetical protein
VDLVDHVTHEGLRRHGLGLAGVAVGGERGAPELLPRRRMSWARDPCDGFEEHRILLQAMVKSGPVIILTSKLRRFRSERTASSVARANQ